MKTQPAAKKSFPKKKKVRMVEAILAKGKDPGQDATSLGETLRMLGLLSGEPIEIGTKQSKEDFLRAVLDGDERFVHISAHGSEDALLLHGSKETRVTSKFIEGFMAEHPTYASGKAGRFLTISACGSITGKFAPTFGRALGVTAVIAPMTPVGFGESSVFFSMFYFALQAHESMNDKLTTMPRLARYIDAFQRSKAAFLGIGGGGTFRLDWFTDDGGHEYTL